MSKQLIEKKDVAEAIDALKRGGKTVNLNSIRAALGNKGSLSTISDLKKEIEEDAAASLHPPHALAAFQAIWGEAIRKGREERSSEITDLKELNDALVAEIKTLEGQTVAAESMAAEMKAKHELISAKLTSANEATLKAREDAEKTAMKLVELITDHEVELSKGRQLYKTAQDRAHELEIQLTRVTMELNVRNTKSPQRIRKSLLQQNAVLE